MEKIYKTSVIDITQMNLSEKVSNQLKSILLVLAVFVAGIGSVWGQVVAGNYNFNAITGTFTALTSPTAAPGVGTTDDVMSTSDVPLGFTFSYGGVNQTVCRLSSNGQLVFGSSGTSTTLNNLATTTSTERSGLSPLWDDLQPGAVSYLTTGTAPNRIFTAQWLNMEWNFDANTPVISFQVKLYETTNVIEFIYRSEAGGVLNNSSGASIGLMGAQSTDFISLSSSGTAPTLSTTTSTNNIGTKPATGQIYRFSPALPLCPFGVPSVSGTTTIACNGTSTLSIPLPTGGAVTTSGNYRIHTFTAGGNFVVPAGFSGNVEYLIVAGGGSGGSINLNSTIGAGGGGGGGLITSVASLSAQTYAVVVGVGGTGISPGSNNGSNSSFNGQTATGGGAGGHQGDNTTSKGKNGGSGGGGRNAQSGGTGVASQGNNGGLSPATTANRGSGGGGGANGVGGITSSGTGGTAGPGFTSSISGGSATYAVGGVGGGGGQAASSNGANATANTGNGGGGATASTNSTARSGGNGGSGIVIIRYIDPSGGTWSSSNATVASVNSSGAVTANCAGTATLTYSVTKGLCTQTATASVTVNSCGAPTITSFTPSAVCASSNATVVITGTNFNCASAVTIGGTAAQSFVVDSKTQITATIGAGTTGTISVTTPGGSVTSSSSLTVNAIPTITLGSTPNICAGDATFSVPYSSTTLSPTTYSIGTPSPAISGFSTVSSAALPASPISVSIPTNAASGTYAIPITVSNGTCSSVSQNISLTVSAVGTGSSWGLNGAGTGSYGSGGTSDAQIAPTCGAKTISVPNNSFTSVSLISGRSYTFSSNTPSGWGTPKVVVYFSTNSGSTWSVGAIGNNTINYTAPASPGSSYYYLVTVWNGSPCAPASSGNNATLTYQENSTSAGTAPGNGNGVWNILAYEGVDINLGGSLVYKGYFTSAAALSYNTTTVGANGYDGSGAPSYATTWTGCNLDVNNHTVVAKRTNFTCGLYQLDVPTHDDGAILYLNGNAIWSHTGSCCDVHTNLAAGSNGGEISPNAYVWLNASDVLEFRHVEGWGGSNQGLTFTDRNSTVTALSGGTIAGVSNNTMICSTGDPGAFTNSVAAGGGSPTTGLNAGSYSYQWEVSFNGVAYGNVAGGSGSTTAAFDPNNATFASGTGTYDFRRKVTDSKCATVAYSNILRVVVSGAPSQPTIVASAASICQGANSTLTVSAGALGGPTNVASSLVAHYPFYNNLTDASGNGLNLSGTGNFNNGGVNLTGSTLTSVSTSILNTDNHTIAFYMKYTTPSDATWNNSIFRYAPAGTDRSPTIWKYNGQNWHHWQYATSANAFTGAGDGAVTYTVGQWYYVVGVKNGSTFTLYTDGVQVANGPVADPKFAGNAVLQFGSADGVVLREFKIFNKSMTSAEVAQLGQWKWYSSSCGGTLIANGPSVTVSPNTLGANTYYARGENTCGNSTCGSTAITVNQPTSISYTGSPFSYCLNNAITNLTPSVTGTPSGYTISPALPTGLSFSTLTGAITGTPTLASAATTYTITATGTCPSSTTISITTLTAPTNVNAGYDVAICSGSSNQFTASATAPQACTGSTTSTNSTAGSIPDNNATGVTRTINVPASCGIASEVISVSVNITHVYNADIDMYLLTPGGVQIALAEDKGSSGDNYNCRFITGGATLPTGAVSITGDVAPQTAFSSLGSGSAVGNWSLVVKDDAGTDVGTLNSWSIVVKTLADMSVTYSWSPGTFLSSTTVSNPTASNVTSAQTYTMTATANGCSVTDQVAVSLRSIPAATAANNSPICAGNTVDLTASALAPSGQGVTMTNNATDAITGTTHSGVLNNHTMEFWVNPSKSVVLHAEHNSGVIASLGAPTTEFSFAISPNLFGGSGCTPANVGLGVSVGTNGIEVVQHGPCHFPVTLSYTGSISGWTHVAVVHISDVPYLYVNGNLVKVGMSSLYPTFPNSSVSMGYGYFGGSIDNIRVWNVSRTASQIVTDMNREVPSVASGLLQNLPLNGNGNALTGNNATVAGSSYSVPTFYTYTWSGTSAPTASTAQTQTSGTLTATGNYNVTATAGGCAGTASNITTVTVNPLPSAAGTITGSTAICKGQIGVTYSVPAITNATGYTWSLPTGASITAGSNTNSITVSYSSSPSSGNITVQGTNSCGNGTISANLPITITQPQTSIQVASTTIAQNDYLWVGLVSQDAGNPNNWYRRISTGYDVASVVPTTNDKVFIVPITTATSCVSNTNSPTNPSLGAFSSNNVFIENGASLTLADGSILNVTGNFVNNGALTAGTGTVNFTGSAATQTISGTGALNFSNVSINKSAGEVSLSNNISISGALTFNNGNLNLNGKTLNYSGGNISTNSGIIGSTTSSKLNFTASSQIPSNLFLSEIYDLEISGTDTDVTSDAEFTIANDLIVGSQSTLTLNDGRTVTMKGNITNNGTINGLGTSSELIFNKDGSQTVTGAALSVGSMTIDKLSGNLTLNAPIQVKGALTMTKGDIITTTSNILEIGSSATSVGSVSWATGTVRGPMKRWFSATASATQASGIFPIGADLGGTKGVTNRYAQVNFTQTTPGGYIIAEYKTGLPLSNDGSPLTAGLPLNYSSGSYPQAIQNFEEEGYWDITPYSVSGVSYADLDDKPYTLKLRMNNPSTLTTGWTPNIDGNDLYDASTIRLIRSKGSSSGTHGNWELAGTHVSATGDSQTGDYYITSSGITGFSWFNGGGNNQNPLPVELLNFNGTCNEGMVDLLWQTASEFNSSHFDVEKSTDGETWRVLATIPSAGTSNELLTYQTVDNNGTQGNNYYRLRQVDIDGKEKLYDPINVSCAETTVGYFTSYPNPSGNEFQVIVNNKEILGACTLNIVDAQGKVIDQRKIEVKDGINMFVISEKLTPGIYFLNITNGTKTTQVIKHAVK